MTDITAPGPAPAPAKLTAEEFLAKWTAHYSDKMCAEMGADLDNLLLPRRSCGMTWHQLQIAAEKLYGIWPDTIAPWQQLDPSVQFDFMRKAALIVEAEETAAPEAAQAKLTADDERAAKRARQLIEWAEGEWGHTISEEDYNLAKAFLRALAAKPATPQVSAGKCIGCAGTGYSIGGHKCGRCNGTGVSP